jgi:Undecaprenyl-phosphate glucose phosphotransferase
MTAEIPKFTIFRDYLVFMLLLWGTVFSFSNLYSSQRLVPRSIEAWRILRAHSLATLLFVALTYLVSTYKLSRGVFLYFYISSSFGFVFSRIFLRFILRSLRKRGHNLHRVLFIGASKASLAVYNKLIKHPELGLEIVGFIEGKLSGTTTNSSNISATALPKPCLGSIDQLKSIIEEWHIYRVIIALERDQALNVDIALNQLKDSMAEIILIPDVYEYLQLGCTVEDFDGIPMVSLNESPIAGFHLFVKRLSDIVIATFALIIFAPLMLTIALLIKLTSRGPIFYRQERMSLNGRHFHMLKFRSMTIDQAGDTELLTKANDPRVTKIGRFIRRTSLDELPQLINVFLGDMSIVGPRPERTWVVEQVRTKIPSYMLKHKVKAGITGWAQVNGWRGDTSLEKRIEYDLYYIKNWSPVLDFKIILLTVFNGFVNKNAY